MHTLVFQDCGHRRKAVDYAKVCIYLTNRNADSSCTENVYLNSSMIVMSPREMLQSGKRDLMLSTF